MPDEIPVIQYYQFFHCAKVESFNFMIVFPSPLVLGLQIMIIYVVAIIQYF